MWSLKTTLYWFAVTHLCKGKTWTHSEPTKTLDLITVDVKSWVFPLICHLSICHFLVTMFGALRSYFHGELVLPANPVDHIPAGHTSMTQPSEHTSKYVSNKNWQQKPQNNRQTHMTRSLSSEHKDATFYVMTEWTGGISTVVSNNVLHFLISRIYLSSK